MRFVVIASCLVLCFSGIYADPDPNTTLSTTSSEVPTTSVKTTVPSTEPTTTASPPTTTSKGTTTPVPPTTTPAPPTTTGTPSPSPTVSPTFGPTVGPTELPKPSVGNYNVTEGNTTCIRADMALQIEISDKKIMHNLAPNASTTGSNCNLNMNATTQTLVLTDEAFQLTFIFSSDKEKTFVQNISVSYTSGSEVYNQEVSGEYFKAHNGRSYYCMSDNKVNVENVTLEFSSVQLQSFGKESDSGFLKAEDCDADDKMNDIVPIAVACALCGMIVVILIGYLIGRRQTRQRDYQSM